MSNLKKILNRTRNGKFSQHDKDFLANFVAENSSIAEMEIPQIKMLTKSLTDLIKEDKHCLSSHLQTVYVYHLEGINKLQATPRLGQSNRRSLHSHLLSHNADVCFELYNHDFDAFWLREGKSFATQSAEMNMDHDGNYASRSLCRAAEISHLLYRETGSLAEADEAYELGSKSISIRDRLGVRSFGPSTKLYKLAKEVFTDCINEEELTVDDKFTWGKRAFNSLKNLIDKRGIMNTSSSYKAVKSIMGKMRNVVFNAKVCTDKKFGLIQNIYTMEEEILEVLDDPLAIADCHFRLAGLAQDQLSLKNDIKIEQAIARHYDKSGEGYLQLGKRKSANKCFKNSVGIWMNLHDSNKNELILQRCYVSQALLVETTDNPKEKALASYALGQVSYKLFKATKNLQYHSEGTTCLNNFLGYIKRHRKQIPREKIRNARSLLGLYHKNKRALILKKEKSRPDLEYSPLQLSDCEY
tara:strand:- start:32871 stop:34280 length:1410 start_codon:yes stop_codon:yes gene_type:complete